MTNLREVLRARYGQMSLERTRFAASSMSGSAFGDDNWGVHVQFRPNEVVCEVTEHATREITRHRWTHRQWVEYLAMDGLFDDQGEAR